ncbi:MAG: hypothetical protein OXU61_04180 [Gammaproteobacteria bacterium]|nr:hypothetical protein [Gammaproteobacteria bacterium]
MLNLQTRLPPAGGEQAAILAQFARGDHSRNSGSKPLRNRGEKTPSPPFPPASLCKNYSCFLQSGKIVLEIV